MSTHREVHRAKWPTVACRFDRFRWVESILEDEGINIDPRLTKDTDMDFPGLALAILKDIYSNDLQGNDTRQACFAASLELEKLLYREDD